MAEDQREDRGNRGRSEEARDPDRPVDEFGEKEGLGPRDESAEDDAAETTEEEAGE